MALTWINPLHEKQVAGDSALRRDSAALRNPSFVSSITALRINQERLEEMKRKKFWRKKVRLEI
jgi:hypothetical protein